MDKYDGKMPLVSLIDVFEVMLLCPSSSLRQNLIILINRNVKSCLIF